MNGQRPFSKEQQALRGGPGCCGEDYATTFALSARWRPAAQQSVRREKLL